MDTIITATYTQEEIDFLAGRKGYIQNDAQSATVFLANIYTQIIADDFVTEKVAQQKEENFEANRIATEQAVAVADAAVAQTEADAQARAAQLFVITP